MPSLDEQRLTHSEFSLARERIAPFAINIPALSLRSSQRAPLWLKAEMLQPIGSFKIRCAANALLGDRRVGLRSVYTASAGNFAQGLAFVGQALGVSVTSFVPETAAASKLDALRTLGAEISVIPYQEWWQMLVDPPADREFIHPAADIDLIIGNGTIGIELLEQLPDLASVYVPFGGGGLAIGVAASLRAMDSPARVVVSESSAGTPFRGALEAGRPVRVPFDPATFITGMGGFEVLEATWRLAASLLCSTTTVSLDDVADAIRTIVHSVHVVPEGAGTVAVAAARKDDPEGVTACILSGGHIDTGHLLTILAGEAP